MGKQIGNTTGAKVLCSDCGATWIEGKAYNNRDTVLRHLKNKEDFYMSLDTSLVPHDGSRKGRKTIACCPFCEATSWELRLQTARKAWSKSKKRQEELARKYSCYLYTRLFYGGEIKLIEKGCVLIYNPDGEFILIRYNKNGVVHSRVSIPIGQVTMRIRRLVDFKLIEDNKVERAVNMHTLLKKLSIHGEF